MLSCQTARFWRRARTRSRVRLVMVEEPVIGTVTGWIGELKTGQGAAAEPLWNRYFERTLVA